MPEMMELATKDFKTAIVNMLYMFKMIEGNMKMKRKQVDFLKTQMELLEMKNIVSEMKTTLDEINSILDTAKEKKSMNLKT